jgi:hypothetical protein
MFYRQAVADEVASAKTQSGGRLLGLAVRQGGRLPRPGQIQFGVDPRGNGRLNFCHVKGAQAAKSRRDVVTMAQPFMAGHRVHQMQKSRRDGSMVRSGF